jgi:hypothetical protein
MKELEEYLRVLKDVLWHGAKEEKAGKIAINTIETLLAVEKSSVLGERKEEYSTVVTKNKVYVEGRDFNRGYNYHRDQTALKLTAALEGLEGEISCLIENYIEEWVLMKDCPANRERWPENSWYGKDPLRVIVSHVGIDKLRKLKKSITALLREKLGLKA